MKKNKKLAVLYLSKNMIDYSAASYQNEVMLEFTKQFRVFFYGPGFPDYIIEDNIEDIIKKCPFKLDALIMGHSWLSDESIKITNISSFNRLNLSNLKLKKIIILNKEYVNLKEKLKYIKENNFDICFTHHHDVALFTKETNVNHIYWPFAMNRSKFLYAGEKKKIDIAFSGTLKNYYHKQSDLRIKIMQEFFYCFSKIPLIKKVKYSDLKIKFNIKPYTTLGKIINKFLYTFYVLLEDKDYKNLTKETKIFVNTLSPADLISPRYYECMASKALVLCEESNLYSDKFPDDTYVTFKDIKSFKEKIKFYLDNDIEREKITNNAYLFVKDQHTWEARVGSIKENISLLLK